MKLAEKVRLTEERGERNFIRNADQTVRRCVFVCVQGQGVSVGKEIGYVGKLHPRIKKILIVAPTMKPTPTYFTLNASYICHFVIHSLSLTM